MDDCERRGLPAALGPEEDVVEETELNAALLGSRLGTADDDGLQFTSRQVMDYLEMVKLLLG